MGEIRGPPRLALVPPNPGDYNVTRDKTLIGCCECGKGYPPAEMFPAYNHPTSDPICAQCLAKKGIEEGFFTQKEAEEFLGGREPK